MRPSYAQWFACGPRAIGRTYQLANAVKNLNGILVCHNSRYAKDVARQYGIKTMAIDDNPVGTRGPYIFDHIALEQIGNWYESRIEHLEAENRSLKKRVADICAPLRRPVSSEVSDDV